MKPITALRLPWTHAPSRPEDPAGEGAGPAVGPPGIQIQPRRLDLTDGVCASLVITGYPREVGLGWLELLLPSPGRLYVAFQIDPTPPQVAASRLRRRLA